MRSLVSACALLLLLGCGATENRSALLRRPLSQAPQSGWVRLPLNGEVQRQMTGLWIGDSQGRSVPFLVEREGLWEPRRLELQGVLLGRDPEGRPTADFSLKFPEGWQVREREQLHIELDLEGSGSWVCPVKVERRGEGGGPITLEQNLPFQVFRLEGAGESRTISIPWDARSYRITLLAAYGKAPRIRGLKVTARTEPDRQNGEWLTPQVLEKKAEGRWRVKLSAQERVVGLDLRMDAPLAPVHPEVFLPKRAGAEESLTHCEGLVWNLPALDTRSSRVSIAPVIIDELELRFPNGANLASARVLVRRETLLFPAEAGAAYYLHLGGQAKKAPGDLGALPDSSRALYQRKPLSLGNAETDHQGIPHETTKMELAAESSRPWLPWIAGAVVAVLAVVGLRLLKR